MDAQEKPELTQAFLSKKTPKDLYRFFAKNGYEDVAINDCKDIIKARRSIGGRKIPGPGETPCVGRTKEY